MPPSRAKKEESRDGRPRSPPGELERGRDLYHRHSWAEAYEALSLADEKAPLGVEDLELLAWSAGLIGRDDDLLKAMERLYRAHADVNQGARAARWAFWSGFRLLAKGEVSQGAAWLARAQHLVEGEGQDCVVEGYLLLPLVRRHFHAGEFDAAYDAALGAARIGDRFGEIDLSVFARNLQGRVLLRKGQIQTGLALMDEAMLAAKAGELSPIITGLLYCSAIDSCHGIYALDRAREWTSTLAGWCEAQPQLVTFTGACLVHRAEIMQLSGAWGEAIEQAQRVASAGNESEIADASYQEAEVHRLRGEFTTAEEAYRNAGQAGREPQPGLALLRLAQGRADTAANGIRPVLGAATDPLERARLLPAHVEIMLAIGDVEAARAASEELGVIAGTFDTEVLRAMAANAEGLVRLAEGDPRAALALLRGAFQVWQRVGAPHVAARIRVAIARACRALGDEDGTRLELHHARSVFERLGALPDVAAVDAFEDRPAPVQDHGLTPRELQVLRLVAAGKTNRAIAQELCLSEKTVDRHVSNIFTKVSVSSRAAATAYAYEHKLI